MADGQVGLIGKEFYLPMKIIDGRWLGWPNW
jgi:hypothetical protein